MNSLRLSRGNSRTEWRDVYEALSRRTTNIVRFERGTFEYLYDDYASLEATAGFLTIR